VTNAADIRIPDNLLPGDGRFGSGPSKVRPEAATALADMTQSLLGTSHRQKPVRKMVGELRSGLANLFSLPDGYEVVLGNGGTTVFWDALIFGLIERKSQHLSFGEFSAKFATAVDQAPFLEPPHVIKSDTGTHPHVEASADIDLYALTHNETSTGVAMEVTRPSDATGLIAVDATSAAGGLRVDPTQFDCYYFAPQKGMASDGGLWLALMSPKALERVEQIKASGRWIPTSIDIATAVENSRLDQTYNTPALATIFLALHQVNWVNTNGGLEWAASRCDRSSEILYSWAERSSYASPYVAKPDERSHVVGTIDLEPTVDAGQVSVALRANGIVDIDGYRKLGRNQIRIAMFPAIEPDDIDALTNCVDYVVETLS